MAESTLPVSALILPRDEEEMEKFVLAYAEFTQQVQSKIESGVKKFVQQSNAILDETYTKKEESRRKLEQAEEEKREAERQLEEQKRSAVVMDRRTALTNSLKSRKEEVVLLQQNLKKLTLTLKEHEEMVDLARKKDEEKLKILKVIKKLYTKHTKMHLSFDKETNIATLKFVYPDFVSKTVKDFEVKFRVISRDKYELIDATPELSQYLNNVTVTTNVANVLCNIREYIKTHLEKRSIKG